MEQQGRSVSNEVAGVASVAFHAVEWHAQPRAAAGKRRHPGAFDPRWLMTHMLMMAARQLRHPVALVVAMKTDDGSLHQIGGSGVRQFLGGL